MELEAQTLTGAVPPRKNGRYTASLVLALCAAAGVSYSVASSRSTPIAELSADWSRSRRRPASRSSTRTSTLCDPVRERLAGRRAPRAAARARRAGSLPNL